MTPLFAAIAIVLILLVLGFVLWPLWKRPAGKRQRITVLGMLVALALSTMALYHFVGMPAALSVPTK